MAKSVSEEELQLKKRARRRLIGAIALVAAVTAVLPMILDSEPKPGPQDISIQIPSPEPKGTAVAKVAPSVPPKAETPAKSEAEKVEAQPPATAKAAAKPADNPNDVALSRSQKAAPDKARPKAPEKTAEKTPVPAAVPKAGPGAFFIQVIALSEADKAKQVQQKIAAAGVRAYTESVSAGSGQVTRVRAGPFATRDEADKAQARLQGIGFEGKVAAY